MKANIPGPVRFCRYVWDIKLYILAVIAMFAVFYAIGYVAAVSVPQVGNTVMSNFKEEVSPLKDLSPLGLMLGIFANNALKCLLVIVLGIAFGIAPVLFIMANGLILGIVIGVTLARTSLLYVLVGVVPHGIIEMPMVFISSAIGLKLGVDALRAALAKLGVNTFAPGEKEGLPGRIREGLMIYLVWVLPLLFLAAFIETFITGPILYMIFGGQG